MDESGEMEVSNYMILEAKAEPLAQEPVDEESASRAQHQINYGPSLEEHTIGPAQAKYRITFPVAKTYYCNQRFTLNTKPWTIAANSRNEFQENLFTVCEPYIRRCVEYPRGQEMPCFAEKENPSSDDMPQYVVFRDNKRKRNFKWDQVDENCLARWSRRSDLMMQLYVYGTNIYGRQAWELVKKVLFDQNIIDPTLQPKETTEEQKLLMMVRRLKRIHYSTLIEKVDDAFEVWARWILQAPARNQSGLSYSKPPPELMKNFVQTEKECRKLPTKKRRLISGPAQREHTTDGFGFEDEVQAMRQTVSQIRDLVEMLDRRVTLLESKCQGFRQTVQGTPPKKARWEFREEEPPIDDPEEEPADRSDRSGNYTDPLLNEDSFKQEYLDEDD